MPLDIQRTRKLLKSFDFNTLFIEELGWDNYTSRPLEVVVSENTFTLSPVAEKRGLGVFLCTPGKDGNTPNNAIRRKIEKQVAKSIHEHIIIYTDAAKTAQVWQWVKRETGKPVACREHFYHKAQLGEALIQKLKHLVVTLSEEEELTIPDVAGRARRAFDVDRVTKRFYDHFKEEHTVFRKFIEGIEEQDDLDWYTSVMLNRLMFIYFIQKKGFLDEDINYLSNRLNAAKGKNRFYSDFLLPLFFEGLAKEKKNRSIEANNLLGEVPYMNGGIFLPHKLEQVYDDKIYIPDKAFERLFNYFEQYSWHLDERPLRADDEINPDVLGYIFEKYINQKQMGAYYTKEDVTEYISKNTVIPFLFDEAQKKCKIAFESDQSVWSLLKENPERYIYPTVSKGVELPLPKSIAAGLKDVSKRAEWNKLADEEYALPTEIWREVVARRNNYAEVRDKLSAGNIRSINDFITYNLDIRQFAQDVIENSEGPELLRAFWHAIENVTVLDPTCGSGAFLFAALNILEPLYEACLGRMQAFLEDLQLSGRKYSPEQFSDFREVLECVEEHPNHRYFVLKSIIINNLYGVDLMEEATEICKLRLFLKLMAQVEHVKDIEPLPDIDFNIRAGNTLVGYASYEEVERAVKGDKQFQMDFGNDMQGIEEKAQIVDREFKIFREMQTEHGVPAKKVAKAKQDLRIRLNELEDEFNRHLAGDYGVKSGKTKVFEKWLKSHQPFHWFIEFYGIIKNGGFDVIIGNPPYIEYSKVRREYVLPKETYKTELCGNLYAFIIERCFSLSDQSTRHGFIIPTSSISTERMRSLQKLISREGLVHSTYGFRPAKLFEGPTSANIHLSIIFMGEALGTNLKALHHIKWNADFRPYLFDSLPPYTVSSTEIIESFDKLPRIANSVHAAILTKLIDYSPAEKFFSNSDHRVYYRTTGGLHYRVFTIFPTKSKKEASIVFDTQQNRDIAYCVYASNLWNMFYYTFSNCLDVARFDINKFPIGLDYMSASVASKLMNISKELDKDTQEKAHMRTRSYKDHGDIECLTIEMRESKLIIDKIDCVLAEHYGFTDEELDFIINYDIKYRMGRNLEE